MTQDKEEQPNQLTEQQEKAFLEAAGTLCKNV